MGANVTRTDFEWVSTEEPHAARRKLILEKYPQIQKLFGHDPMFKWIVTALVIVQMVSLPIIQHLSWPALLLTAYCFGGVINHSLTLALHDVSHDMAFGANRPLANGLFGIFANLPLGYPVAINLKKYHKEHHRCLGVDGMDADLPTLLEAKLFHTAGGKLVWLFLFPLVFLLRTLLRMPKALAPMELNNIIVQALFNTAIVHLFGWKILVYLIFGSFITTSLHPIAGHYIGEHYMFHKGYETYSYYGTLNWITFNTGYHNEHHDFPEVPSSRLPQIKRIAPEYYENLPQHISVPKILYDFVMDPQLGLYSRIKRKPPLPHC